MADPTYNSVSSPYAGAVGGGRPGESSFYALGRFWFFYTHGGTAYYNTSTDNSTWAGETSIGTAASRTYCAWTYDGTYIHYMRYVSSNIYYRRGTPASDGTISWSAAEQTISLGTDTLVYPSIKVDGSGHAVIGAGRLTGTTSKPTIWRNANTDGTWSNDTGFPYAVDSTGDTNNMTVFPCAMSNGDIWAVYWNAAASPNAWVRAKLWTASTTTWDSSPTTLDDAGLGDQVPYADVACDGTHIIYGSYSVDGGARLRIIRYTGSWQTAQVLNYGVDYLDKVVPVLGVTDGNAFLVYTKGSPGSHLYVRYSTDHGATWSGEFDLYTNDATLGDRALDAFRICGSNKIAAIAIDSSHTHFVVFDVTDVAGSTAVTVTDTTSLTDTSIGYYEPEVIILTKTVAKTSDDTINLTDLILGGKTIIETDSSVLADLKLVGKTLFETEIATLADTDYRGKSFVGTDAVSLADVDIRGKSFAETDTLTLADSVVKGRGVVELDSLSLSDVDYRGKSFVEADTSVLTDSYIRNKTILTTLDTASLSDSDLRGKSFIETDVSSLADIIVLTLGKIVADVIGAADIKYLNKGAISADAVGIADSMLRPTRSFVETDTSALTDLKLVGKTGIETDSLSLADVDYRGKSFIEIDSSSLADNILTTKTTTSLDTITVDDVATRTGGSSKSALDSVSISDIDIIMKTVTFAFDAVGLVDVELTGKSGLIEADSTSLADIKLVGKTFPIYDSSRLATTVPTETALKAYYDMESKTTGGKLYDLTGNGNDATPSAGVSIGAASGVVGGATNFNATSVSSANGASTLDINGQGLTMEAWVKADSSGTDMIILRKSWSDYWVWKMYYRSTRKGYGVVKTDVTSKSITGNTAMTDGQWNHVVVTYDGTNLNLYLNGKIDATPVALTGNVATHPYGLVIAGSDPYGTNFLGSVDTVRIYDRPLTAAEVRAHYEESFLLNKGAITYDSTKAGPAVPSDANLILYHDMESLASANVLRDLSGTGNNGTIVGGAGAGKSSQAVRGGAIDFDGVDDYIRVTDNSGLTLADEFTVSMWVYPHNKTQMIIDKGVAYGSWGIFTNGTNYVAQVAGWFNWTPTTIDTNSWQHVVLRFSKPDVAFFKNGIKSTQTRNVSNADTAQDLLIGANWVWHSGPGYIPDNFFDGAIDEVQIYSRALTDDEVRHLYDESKYVNKDAKTLDVLTALDAELRGKSFTESESIALVDALLYTFGKQTIDAVTLLDSGTFTKALKITDIVGLLELIIRGGGGMQTVFDSVAASDAIYRGLAVLVLDAFGITDADIRDRSALIAEAISIADSDLRGKSFSEIDSISAAEILSTPARSRITLDNVTAAELLLLAKFAIAVDAIAAVDTATAKRVIEYVTKLYGRLSRETALGGIKARSTALAGVLTLATPLLASKAPLTALEGLFDFVTELEGSTPEGVGIGDAVTIHKNLQLQPDYISLLSEDVFTTKVRFITDGVVTLDSVMTDRSLILTPDDLFLSSESIYVGRAFAPQLDGIVVDEVCFASKQMFVLDAITATDVLNSADRDVYEFETITASESPILKFAGLIIYEDSFSLESISANHALTADDSLLLVEADVLISHILPPGAGEADNIFALDSFIINRDAYIFDTLVSLDTITITGDLNAELDGVGAVEAVLLNRDAYLPDDVVASIEALILDRSLSLSLDTITASDEIIVDITEEPGLESRIDYARIDYSYIAATDTQEIIDFNDSQLSDLIWVDKSPTVATDDVFLTEEVLGYDNGTVSRIDYARIGFDRIADELGPPNYMDTSAAFDAVYISKDNTTTTDSVVCSETVIVSHSTGNAAEIGYGRIDEDEIG